MARILRIFDVSSYAHAGKVNKRAFIEGDLVKTSKGWTQKCIQAGGASLIFNQIFDYYETSDLLFCVDRNPTIKKQMLPSYKENRNHSSEVEKQKEVAEIILESCGFTLLYEEGYEADDFIYSAVRTYYNEYDKIYVHTADSDMYFLVDEKVEIAKSHSRTKEVDIDNYSYSFGANTYTPYNSGSFLKMLYGDTSDTIPPMDKDLAKKLYDALDSDFYRKRMGNKEFLRSMFEFVDPAALPQFDIVYPLDVYVPEELKQGDMNLIKEWGYAMKNAFFTRNVKATQEVTDKINYMVERGLAED